METMLHIHATKNNAKEKLCFIPILDDISLGWK